MKTLNLLKNVMLVNVCTIALVVSSCKKDDEKQKNLKLCKVSAFKTFENYNNTTTPEESFSLGYDSQSRLSEIRNNQGLLSFSYQPQQIIASDEENVITYNLDAAGRISGAKAKKLGGNYEETIAIKYNNQGYLIELKSSVYNITTTLTYTNGELTKVEEVELGYTLNSKRIRTSEIIYKDETSTNDFVHSKILPGLTDGILRHNLAYLLMPTLGKPAKRLIDKINYTVESGGITNSSLKTFIYLKDEKGNIIKAVRTHSDYSNSEVFEFDFTCQ
jgi:hypothetical protein